MSTENQQDPQFSSVQTALAELQQAQSEDVGSASGTAVATAVAREPQTVSEVAAEMPEDQAISESIPLTVQSSDAQATDAQSPDVQSDEAAGVDSLEASEGVVSDPKAELVASTDAVSAETVDSGETSETMDQLLDQFATPEVSVAQGEVFEGHVLAVTEAGVVVDVGGKFEGIVPAQEFVDAGNPIEFGPGQTIEVERLSEHKDGYVLLSHIRAHRRRVWERIEKSYREHATIAGKVVERIKGGLVVNIGVRAFLPASQVELRPVHDLESWKDRDIDVRVLKLNRKRGNVVVSRRAILEEDAKAQRDALAETLSEGAVVTGRVKNVTDYGVFVDLGGIDGLLHVSDLVWGRVPNPSTLVKAGDEIQVQILKFDKEKQRISLGRKQLLPDPWATVPERFPVGTRLQGAIVGVTDYGAFVQIEPGVEGLVHVSEMSWSKRTKHPSKIVKVGDSVDVVVLELKLDQRRISLGLKQTLPDPWEAAAQKYPVGTLVTGKIRNLADFGAFVEVEDGMEGLIHISDMSWTARIKHPSEKFKKGDSVEARVLKVDSENRRLSLGVKQVNDIWGNWFAENKVGSVLSGRVVRTTDFGAFVELAEGIEGLCHVSEIEERRPKGAKGGKGAHCGRGAQAAQAAQAAQGAQGERGKEGDLVKPSRAERVTSVLSQGQSYDFKILRLEPEQRKISLSYRAAQKQVEKQEIEAFRAPKTAKSSPNATIGDAILAKRQASSS